MAALAEPTADARAERSELSKPKRAAVVSVATTPDTPEVGVSVHSTDGCGTNTTTTGSIASPSSSPELSPTTSPSRRVGSPASARRLKKLGPEVTLQEAVHALPEMCGDLFISPKRLRRRGRLGAGAFATVDACDLLPPQPAVPAATLSLWSLLAPRSWKRRKQAHKQKQQQQQLEKQQDGQQQQQQLEKQHVGQQLHGEPSAVASSGGAGGGSAGAASIPVGIARVAVKRLRPECLPDKEALKDFVMEVLVGARLKHSCIVQTLGVGAAGSSHSNVFNPRKLYVVQELMPGGTLRSLLRSQELKPKSEVYTQGQALRWAIDIARGLRYLHSAHPQVIHRDLKPDNVLLDSKDLSKAHAKLADFGLMVIAQQRDEQHRAAPSPPVPSSRQGGGCGGGLLLPSQGAPAPFPSPFAAQAVQRRRAAEQAAAKASGGGRDSQGHGQAEAAMHDLIGGELKARSAATPLRSESLQDLAVERQGSKLAGLNGMLGSVPYIAPEIVRKQPYDEKCDMFAYGMLLYELFSGQRVTRYMVDKGGWKDDPSFMSTAAKLVADGQRPDFPPNFPEEICPIVESCWSEDPAQRMSADKVVDVLWGLQDQGALAKDKQQQQQQQRRRQQRQQEQQRRRFEAGNRHSSEPVIHEEGGPLFFYEPAMLQQQQRQQQPLQQPPPTSGGCRCTIM